MAQLRKADWSEGEHPRDNHGKFSEGGGGGSGGGSAADHERAMASLSDPAFVGEHASRLSAAGDEVRAAHPREERYTDAVHAQAQTAIHAEAMRIHAENDAAVGPDQAALRDSATSSRWASRSRGGDLAAQHAEVLGGIAREKEHIAQERADTYNIEQAIAAGHITTEVPHEAEDRFNAEHARISGEVNALRGSLDEAHADAADALGRLQAMQLVSEDEDEGEHDWSGKIDKVVNLHESFDVTSEQFSEATGAPEHESFDRTDAHDVVAFPKKPEPGPDPEDRPDPKDRPEKPEPYEHDPEATPEEHAQEKADYKQEIEAWHDEDRAFSEALANHDARAAAHATAATAYEHAIAQYKAEFKSRAADAQTALEALHEHQIAAAEKLPRLEKEHHVPEAARRAEVDDLESDALVNRAAVAHDPEARERAERASEAILERESAKRDSGDQSLSFEDTQSVLKEEMRATAAAIKQLAKVTGRAPKLGGKGKGKTKKSGNRPAGTARASVGGMAPRYKLKLSKLEYVSPVDTPAQETATVLLIKRAGPVKGFARVAKVDEELGLVFCWAFTSKIAGADYHDLQGDAIDEDFIKAAADFMTSGGATDEMHDGKSTGRVVFAMPMTPEIAKAYGVESKTTGLMVALKPPPEVLAKFKSKEYTGVSIAGIGVRELVGKRKMVAKATLQALTDEVEGHAHALDLGDPADEWRDMLSTSYQTATGATEGHSHAWTFDVATGAIAIAADSGHTHTVAAVVPAEILARVAAQESEVGRRCPGCSAECDDGDRFCPSCGKGLGGEAGPFSVENEPSGPTVVVVAARAPAGKSPPSQPTNTVKREPKEHTVANENEKIADLEKRNARLEKMAALTDAQRGYFSKLSGNEAESFLAKSAHERDVVLAEIAKADEVVYESPIDGSKYRKSDDIRLIEMAKRTDEAITKQRAAEIAEREATFAKRGDETLPNFAKGAKNNLRGRIMKALNAEFTVPAEYEEAKEALKGANAAFKQLGAPRGHDGVGLGDTASPDAALRTAVTKYQSDHKLPSYEAALVEATNRDPEIRKLWDASAA